MHTMMRPIALGMIAACAIILPLAAPAAQPTQFHLVEQNSSNETGTATLLQGVKGLIVKLRMNGDPEGVEQPAHIHKGTCAKLDPKPAYGLTMVKNGISETTIPNVTLADLQKGEYAINVHKSTKEIPVYVSCGNFPKSK